MKIKKLFATIMAMVMMIAMTALPVSATTEAHFNGYNFDAIFP